MGALEFSVCEPFNCGGATAGTHQGCCETRSGSECEVLAQTVLTLVFCAAAVGIHICMVAQQEYQLDLNAPPIAFKAIEQAAVMTQRAPPCLEMI